MNVKDILNNVLIYDIETSLIDKDKSPSAKNSKLVIWGAYSYKTNKISFGYGNSFQKLVNQHNIIVGHNIKDFDNPIMMRDAGINFKGKTLIDTLEVLRKPPSKSEKEAFKKKGKKPKLGKGRALIIGEARQIGMADNRFPNLKLGTIMKHGYKLFKDNPKYCNYFKDYKDDNFDYDILNKTDITPDDWVYIKTYLRQDLKVTKNLFEFLEKYFRSFADDLSQEDIKNLDYVNTPTGTYAYKAITHQLKLPFEYGDKVDAKFKGAYVKLPTQESYEPDDGDGYCVDFACFVGNTKILTNKGIINIKDLNINKHKLFNHDGKIVDIIKIHKYKTNNYNLISFKLENEEVITCTKNHKFPINNINNIKIANNINLDDYFISNNNIKVRIKEILKHSTTEIVNVYCPEIDDKKHIFQCESVLSHNSQHPHNIWSANLATLIEKCKHKVNGKCPKPYNGDGEIFKLSGTYCACEIGDIEKWIRYKYFIRNKYRRKFITPNGSELKYKDCKVGDNVYYIDKSKNLISRQLTPDDVYKAKELDKLGVDAKEYSTKILINCFTKGHNILTNNGFEKIENVKKDSMIYSLDSKLRPILLPLQRKITSSTTKTYKIKSSYIDVECTGNHQWYYEEDNKIKIIKTKDINKPIKLIKPNLDFIYIENKYETELFQRWYKHNKDVIIKPSNITTISKKQPVYCVDVGDNPIIVERNGYTVVTHNSSYGILSSSIFKSTYNPTTGPDTTTMSRQSTRFMSKWFEKHGYTVTYGDSVAGDSYIYSKKYDRIKIEDYFNLYNKKHKNIMDNKEIAFTDDKSLSCNKNGIIKWDNCNYIMRHKTDKDMYRINITNTEYIDITKDHSLLINKDNKLIEIKPSDLKVGDNLLWMKNKPINKTNSNDKIYGDFIEVRVQKITKLEKQNNYVYDLCMQKNSNFIANNILVHNTDSVYIMDPYKDKERMKNVMAQGIDKIRKALPFSDSTYNMDVDAEFSHIFFFIDKDSKDKHFKKKNYIYIKKGDKISINGLPILKRNATALAKKIYINYLEPEIKRTKNIKFDKDYLRQLIQFEVEKDINILKTSINVKVASSYASESQYQAQISKRYFDGRAGVFEGIKHKRKGYGIGKGKFYCSLEESKKLGFHEYDLETLWKNLEPFIKEDKQYSIFDFGGVK